MSSRETWSAEEFTGRWSRIQGQMAKAGIDVLLASEKFNFFYLTGLESTQFLHRMRPLVFMLPREGKPVLFVYAAEAAKLGYLESAADIRAYVDIPFPVADLIGIFKEMGWDKAVVGAELGPNQRLGIPVAEYMELQQAIPGASWVDGGPALMAVQAVKTDEEVRLLRQACKISMISWDRLLERVHPGVTTEEILRQASIANVEAGADPNEPFSANCTHLSLGETDGVYRPGDMVKFDFHSRYRGYSSDLCRLAVIGEPTDKHVEWHATQFKLLMDCIGFVKPGIKAQDLAAFGKAQMIAIGQEPLKPIKRMGHGIGIDATAPPSINMLDETVFETGMTIAVEPRVIVDIGALLLEESVLITADGHELLSTGAGTLGVIR
jgi:Xaa-Pro aminopeptidase